MVSPSPSSSPTTRERSSAGDCSHAVTTALRISSWMERMESNNQAESVILIPFLVTGKHGEIHRAPIIPLPLKPRALQKSVSTSEPTPSRGYHPPVRLGNTEVLEDKSPVFKKRG